MDQGQQVIPTVTHKAVTLTQSSHDGTMWAVIARRCTNKGTRYEVTTDLPLFYLDPRVQGITNRAHARRIAGEILGVDAPGSDIHFDVHRV